MINRKQWNRKTTLYQYFLSYVKKPQGGKIDPLPPAGKKSESERKQWRNKNERGQMESVRGKGNESEKITSTQAKCIVGVKKIRELGQVEA